MKGRTSRGTGGSNLAKEDLDTKPMSYTADNNVKKEAEERKTGGRAKRKRGGKLVGCVEGEKAHARADRKPRKNGGRSGSNENPFSSAHRGEAAPGRKEMSEEG